MKCIKGGRSVDRVTCDSWLNNYRVQYHNELVRHRHLTPTQKRLIIVSCLHTGYDVIIDHVTLKLLTDSITHI